jgi:hypothetical protein
LAWWFEKVYTHPSPRAAKDGAPELLWLVQSGRVGHPATRQRMFGKPGTPFQNLLRSDMNPPPRGIRPLEFVVRRAPGGKFIRSISLKSSFFSLRFRSEGDSVLAFFVKACADFTFGATVNGCMCIAATAAAVTVFIKIPCFFCKWAASRVLCTYCLQ